MATQIIECTNGRKIRVEDGKIVSWGIDPNDPRQRPLVRSTYETEKQVEVKGARTRAVIRERAGELSQRLLKMYPTLTAEPVDTIEGLCMEQARHGLLYEHFLELADARGVGDVPAYMLSEISKASMNVLNYLNALGLTTASWAAIAKNMGVAQHFYSQEERNKVDDLVSQGQSLRESQGRRTIDVEGDEEE